MKEDPSASGWSYFARGLNRRGDHDGAIEACRKALAIEPGYTPAWHHLGYALNRRGDHDGAIEAWRKALAIEPENAPAWHNLGIALDGKGDRDGAIEAYRKAIAINPEDADTWNNLGEVLKRNGDHDGAMEAYGKAMAIIEAGKADSKIAKFHAQLKHVNNARLQLVNCPIEAKNLVFTFKRGYELVHVYLHFFAPRSSVF